MGGEISSTVMQQMNRFGRISVCGSISAYNADPSAYPKASVVQFFIVDKQLKMEGFIVTQWNDRWMEGIEKNLQWMREGKIKSRQTVTKGFENMFDAFVNMLSGKNIGKAIVQV